MKTYVLTVSRNFPITHKRAGEETLFVRKIKDGIKIHTIRANYPLWKKRFDEINAGRACLSIRYWSGKPYRSKQVEIVRLTNADEIGIQRLEFDKNKDGCSSMKFYNIDGNFASTIEQVANNDGLCIIDFKEWFKGYDLSEPMAIIHFTKFRY